APGTTAPTPRAAALRAHTATLAAQRDALHDVLRGNRGGGVQNMGYAAAPRRHRLPGPRRAARSRDPGSRRGATAEGARGLAGPRVRGPAPQLPHRTLSGLDPGRRDRAPGRRG